MAQDSGQINFRRGLITLTVLTLLKSEDMYGYQLVQEMASRSGGRLTANEGSLYPVLYRLQEQRLISDKKVQVGKRMMRVYYHLEPLGETKLREMLEEYRTVTTGMFQIIGDL